MTEKRFRPVDPKQSLPKLEHEVIEFWEKEKIFEKSVEQRRGKEKFVFFDGPPFANGLPHYGHILASSIKDCVTRYFTMAGYYIPRVNGWDCHGLPVEYEIEKELKLTGRKDIEKMGISHFNTACRESVFRYTKDWQVLLKRVFRWVDFDNEYATLDNNYMESIWWVFKEIWKKKMVYEDYKPMHICPRCETSLSNFEVTLGYKEVADLSVTVKFELIDEPGTYFLAWTTTPWSLLSTMGLAIGEDFDYVKIRTSDGAQYYVAEKRVEAVFEGLGKYEVIKKLKGKELAHKRYQHLFDFYNSHPEIKKSKWVFHTLLRDYVSIEEGTGIVTINGGFGEIDFESAKKDNIPVFVNVKIDGHFTAETGQYAGLNVKESERHIADDLKNRGLLLRKDPLRHSYPHCWRCDTPLLNYATKSWFIRITEVKDRLIKNNNKITWVPSHIRNGRFGKWLENARDWNISRNRFWGCPIPIWQCPRGSQKCIGSLQELRAHAYGANMLFMLRHGEAQQNVQGIVNAQVDKEFHLTEKGRTQALNSAKKLKREGIEFIFCSPLMRARETAQIIAKATGVKLTIDERLREHEVGDFEGKSLASYRAQFKDSHEWYQKKSEGGESFQEVEERVTDFVNELSHKYKNKKIVIVTHGDGMRTLARSFEGFSVEETHKFLPDFAKIYTYKAGALPLRDRKLDLHKPYIDEIMLECECCGKGMKRITEVLDCWFESGAMPYAQLHYPFENKEAFEKNFPAQFIAEGLDQTRGWFYTLHVLASILFNKPAFKNIIVNGILLAADGEKLSKRKKNYPDPNALFEKHGVDSTRLFLFTSTAPLAQDVRFSEKHVEEMVKQFTLPLWNVYSFFITYANIDGWLPAAMSNVKRQISNVTKLDEWILSELNKLIKEVTEQMDAYNLSMATRPIITFVDTLSNWYIRRSRRRFWKSENDADKKSAYATLYEVLVKLSIMLAPFMPATAETIYKNLTGRHSVHLEDWPKVTTALINKKLNEEVELVRTIVSLALCIRAKHNLKVRQPLQLLRIALPKKISKATVEQYREVILEELNVKELSYENEDTIATLSVTVDARKIGPHFGKDTQEIIHFAKAGDFVVQKDGDLDLPAKGKPRFTLSADEFTLGYKGRAGFDVEGQNGILVSLDTTITPALKQEGWVRDIIRYFQELRKKAGYGIADRIYIYVEAPSEIRDAVTKFTNIIEKETLALELQQGGDFEWDKEETYQIDGKKIKLALRKN